LNHNVLRLIPANRVYGGSSPASRSFVLAALRALHLDPDSGPPPPRSFVLAALRALHLDRDSGPPPPTRAGTRPTNRKTIKDSTFTGVPNTDKDHNDD
jgi:hypothetical protein